ncbi:MAG: fluoride efflux transporter CrcB [Hyphomicrobiales bacterium]|nr:MAG: fluoride efflux transporter CrcB [Hyphomicrobiales bacterium]
MTHFLYVAAGGAIGAGCRHFVGMVALKFFGSGFPYGTLVCNVGGSFLMGILVHILAIKFNAGAELRLFLTTGLLGGFTTFSTFSLDAVILTERGQTETALIYIAISLAGSIAALYTGLLFARQVLT